LQRRTKAAFHRAKCTSRGPTCTYDQNKKHRDRFLDSRAGEGVHVVAGDDEVMIAKPFGQL
jgi:hypothetical protein